jgi:hypothetical protein
LLKSREQYFSYIKVQGAVFQLYSGREKVQKYSLKLLPNFSLYSSIYMYDTFRRVEEMAQLKPSLAQRRRNIFLWE